MIYYFDIKKRKKERKKKISSSKLRGRLVERDAQYYDII